MDEENTIVENEEDQTEQTTPEEPEDDKAIVEELQRKLELAERAKVLAEKALDSTKSENARLKGEQRKQLTEAEQLEEYRKELEEKESDLHRRLNRTAAREALAVLNLTEKELTEDDLDLFVSSDEARTTARCQYLADLVQRRVAAAAKAERDKIQQETPKPTVGDSDSSDDLFLIGFTSAYGRESGNQF